MPLKNPTAVGMTVGSVGMTVGSVGMTVGSVGMTVGSVRQSIFFDIFILLYPVDLKVHQNPRV